MYFSSMAFYILLFVTVIRPALIMFGVATFQFSFHSKLRIARLLNLFDGLESHVTQQVRSI